ncbi:glycoside hydrolase family 127 protein [Bacteroides sp. 224]|uniref:aceric acid hydrolase n=1 Tax=Bacteroides sp. 224 TaxID=2302936 RepID=UPI0013D3E846|nr:glycoside hydrolase family 127 protein [Bacteroides sp. 224]NDV64723.1 glycoside hydrolase family 127 protein [Bacteroides sp. 224]
MKTLKLLLLSATLVATAHAQTNGLTDMSQSKYSQMSNTEIGAVRWTNGFWGDRFNVFENTTILSMWNTWNTPEISHGFRNFEIAAGVCPGEHWGPPFHDGDVYKWLEGVAAVYAVNKDPKLGELMDHVITHIAKAQREDGYIHTPVIIEERNKGIDTHKKDQTVIGTKVGEEDEKGAFANRLNFETYNLGHLMMAAIVHHRATGKRTLLDVAVKATDFLCHFYETASAELARNAICPSHYMGVVEMYRVTRNPRYLELSKNLIDIRGMVENGTDDNQDRVPFRDQKVAMGHAVRANYLYAGVADVYAETGENLLMENLQSIWKDIVTRKMYITGACGALYDGTSPDATCYQPDSIQKVHQSYGRPYQLPNSTAHNETCANIGNMLFNWRMFQTSGDAKYTDLVENCFYNSILSGISLDGKKYFYTNPLRISADLPYTLRWPKERTEYISCFCCPPNTVRTLCEAQNYAYSINEKGIWCNMYGGSELETKLATGDKVKLTQMSDYPWDGNVQLTVELAPKKRAFSLFMRIPEWCEKATLTVNGEAINTSLKANTYTEINRVWKKGDKVELVMDMPVKLMESHPLVEETRNQIAVKRGPLVYCLENIDIENGKRIDDVLIPADIKLTPKKITIQGSPVVALEGTARLANNDSWENTLYRAVSKADKSVNIRLIPYYAWGNRGKTEMTVWMPLSR